MAMTPTIFTLGNEHAKRNTSAVLSEVYIEYNHLAGGNQ